MSLVPKIGNIYVGNNRRTIFLNELTGIYNTDLNIGGYGTPNIDVEDVTETILYITLPDSTVVTITNPIGLPTNNTQLFYQIPYSTIDGESTTIADGLYRFKLTISDGTNTYTSATVQYLFTSNIQCCIDKMFAKIATDSSCACNGMFVNNALYARALSKGLVANGECANTTNITNLINKLNQICGLTDSNCGCGN